MNKIKRLLACCLAVVMTASVFAGCGDADDKKNTSATTSQITTTASDDEIDYDKLVIPEKKLVVDGEEIDTENLVVMTINDKYEVSYDLYRLMYFTVMTQAEIDYSSLDEDKWNDAYKLVKDYVEDNLKRFYIDYIIAEQNGVEVTTDIENQVEVAYQEACASCDGEDNFKKLLLSQYYTPELWKELYTAQLLYSETYSKLYDEGGTYFVTEDEFRDFTKTDGYACTKHILIPFASFAEISEDDMEEYDAGNLNEQLELKEEAYDNLSEEEQKACDEQAKAQIEEILKKLNDGEDFDKLMGEYGWDYGMEVNTDGYYITENTSFVQEYLDATFELEVGQTSDIVETVYGYHIIKRLPVDETYVEENLDDCYEEYYSEYVTAKDSEIRKQLNDEMKVSYCDVYDKFTYDSVN